jgi:hypothetical protein
MEGQYLWQGSGDQTCVLWMAHRHQLSFERSAPLIIIALYRFLKTQLQSTSGARHKALEAVTVEYLNLFKLRETELFQLPHENYRQALATELHAQADLARRLSFEADWVWRSR